MSADTHQYREHFGRSIHIVGRDDLYATLCGRNLPGPDGIKSKMVEGPFADWQICQRCLKLSEVAS